MRYSSMRRVSSRRASSSDVSLGVLFLFAIVLLEQYPDPLDVAMDVADQPHDRPIGPWTPLGCQRERMPPMPAMPASAATAGIKGQTDQSRHGSASAEPDSGRLQPHEPRTISSTGRRTSVGGPNVPVRIACSRSDAASSPSFRSLRASAVMGGSKM